MGPQPRLRTAPSPPHAALLWPRSSPMASRTGSCRKRPHRTRWSFSRKGHLGRVQTGGSVQGAPGGLWVDGQAGLPSFRPGGRAVLCLLPQRRRAGGQGTSWLQTPAHLAGTCRRV